MRTITILYLLAGLTAVSSLRALDPISRSIDLGCEALLVHTEKLVGELEGKHAKDVPGEQKTGLLALELYALVVAGVSVKHPLIERGFTLLDRMSLNYIYGTSTYIFALDAAISQIENDLLLVAPQKIRLGYRDDPRIGSRYRRRLREAVEAIVNAQNGIGAWRYETGSQDYDNSVVQFAVLALGAGTKRNIHISPYVWRKVVDHFVKWQEPEGEVTSSRVALTREGEDRRDEIYFESKDENSKKKRRRYQKKKEREKRRRPEAQDLPEELIEDPTTDTRDLVEVHERGWTYQGHGAKFAMTCGGLSSLLLARERLRHLLSVEEQGTLNRAIRDGYGWVSDHWTPTKSLYAMYSLEKVGDIGHVRRFANREWYVEFKEYLLETQTASGAWIGKHHDKDPAIATSFALLILNRATSLLTDEPGSRIIVSGKAAPQGGGIGNRTWVYIPKLDAMLHVPSLMRAVRLRPTPKLIAFMDTIIDNYDMRWRGELVPELIKLEQVVENRSAKRRVQSYLSDITGCRYKKNDLYYTWHRRWRRVMTIATDGTQAKHAPTLLKYYDNTTRSPTLRVAIMWALMRLKEPAALPKYVEDLGHADSRVRRAAYDNFSAFFVDFPPMFDAAANATVRREQVEMIKNWYREQLRN